MLRSYIIHFQYMQAKANLMHPNKTAGTPEDVAKSITFLASEDATMITGAILPVDGGFSLAGPQKDKIDTVITK